MARGKPRATGPDFVALQVRDLEASARFYEGRLRLERVPQSPPGAVVFRTEPVPFAVREPLVDLGAVERLGWGVSLWLNCDDAQELHHALREEGVGTAGELYDGPFGRTFSFVDPDGYAVTVHDGS